MLATGNGIRHDTDSGAQLPHYLDNAQGFFSTKATAG